MRVWIEQDMCTGDGLCEEICPQVFTLADDGLAYVYEPGQREARADDGLPVKRGAKGLVGVEIDLEAAVEEAREECPGECIFIELD